MGKESTTVVRVDGNAAKCRVLLEPATLICRDGHKRTFEHAKMKRLAAKNGVLSFEYESVRVELDLGKAAATWLEAIKNPRTRVQKLGITPGAKVVVLSKPADEDIQDLEAALGAAPARRLASNTDLVFCFAEEPDELSRLADIEPKLADKGAVWVLWPKGRKDFAHEDVVVAAKHAGLVQTKSIGFSERFSGLRLVRPAGGAKG